MEIKIKRFDSTDTAEKTEKEIDMDLADEIVERRKKFVESGFNKEEPSKSQS